MKWILKIIRKIKSPYFNFEGEFKYNLQFKISFPVINGYKETEIIKVAVPANSPKQAKEKLNKFVKQKIQITVTNIKQCKLNEK